MIIGIEGSFRLEMGWVFPKHKDFMLCNFNAAKQLDMKNVDRVCSNKCIRCY